MNLPQAHFAAIYADPPWRFATWSQKGEGRSPDYAVMSDAAIAALPVATHAAPDCVLFLWVTWPKLQAGLETIAAWGFTYKTCAFSWMKADPYRLWAVPFGGMGYWTRSNSEVCLLATRGKPKRLNADVRQGIIAPRREHSRKPDEIYGRIERLVAGPYLELFARQQRPGWTVWGNETDKYDAAQDMSGSIEECYRAIRTRVAAGGPGWTPPEAA